MDCSKLELEGELDRSRSASRTWCSADSYVACVESGRSSRMIVKLRSDSIQTLSHRVWRQPPRPMSSSHFVGAISSVRHLLVPPLAGHPHRLVHVADRLADAVPNPSSIASTNRCKINRF